MNHIIRNNSPPCAVAHKQKNRISAQESRLSGVFAFVAVFLTGLLFYLSPIGSLPGFNDGMSIGLAFVAGLLTSTHCVSMCGGFVLAFATQSGGVARHFSYALGKTLSYAISGALFGWFGRALAISSTMRGTVGVFSGIALLLFGARMLGVLPNPFSKVRSCGKGRFLPISRRPFMIGCLNGLMILCGPLQAMYIFSATQADPLKGALLLFFFGLGTLPVLLMFGLSAGKMALYVRKNATRLSGIIVIVFGLSALRDGLNLLDVNYSVKVLAADRSTALGEFPPTVDQEHQIIEMRVAADGWRPDSFILQKDRAVRWVIYGDDLNVCNQVIHVPKLDLEIRLKKGKNIVEFTPGKTGDLQWNCWMGMMTGVFKVRE